MEETATRMRRCRGTSQGLGPQQGHNRSLHHRGHTCGLVDQFDATQRGAAVLVTSLGGLQEARQWEGRHTDGGAADLRWRGSETNRGPAPDPSTSSGGACPRAGLCSDGHPPPIWPAHPPHILGRGSARWTCAPARRSGRCSPSQSPQLGTMPCQTPGRQDPPTDDLLPKRLSGHAPAAPAGLACLRVPPTDPSPAALRSNPIPAPAQR